MERDEKRESSSEALSLNDIPLSRELLHYYKTRVDGFEEERHEYLSKLEDIEVQHSEMHRLRWELRRREEEILDLQKTLSDAQVYLFDEREHVLQLQAENDALKIQEIEDRKRIRTLLELSAPDFEEIKFSRGTNPEHSNLYPQTKRETIPIQTVSLPREKSSGPSRKRSPSQSGSVGFIDLVERDHRSTALRLGDDQSSSMTRVNQSIPLKTMQQHDREIHVGGNRILRTIVLPSEETDALVLTIKSLRAMLEEQRTVFADQKRGFLQDRSVLMAEFEQHRQSINETTKRLEEENEKTRSMLRRITGEYLSLRKSSQNSQKKLMEQIGKLSKENQDFRQMLDTLRRGQVAESEVLLKRAESQAEHFMSEFRRQALEREDQLAKQKTECEDLREEMHQREADLLEKLARAQKKYHDLYHRRQIDHEGFKNDLLLLKRQVRDLDTRLRRLPHALGVVTEDMDQDMITSLKEELRNVLSTDLSGIQRKLSRMDGDLENVVGGASSASEKENVSYPSSLNDRKSSKPKGKGSTKKASKAQKFSSLRS